MGNFWIDQASELTPGCVRILMFNAYLVARAWSLFLSYILVDILIRSYNVLPNCVDNLVLRLERH
jgi:hypothetical protein